VEVFFILKVMISTLDYEINKNCSLFSQVKIRTFSLIEGMYILSPTFVAAENTLNLCPDTVLY
jgi:hypothetical protein